MQRPFFGSILAYSSAVLSIAGIAFYCVSRIAYSLYYGHYGISPEDVGVSFQGLLTQEASAINVILLAAVTATFLRAGWLINSARLGEAQIETRIEAASADRDLLIRAIASNAVVDPAAAKRDLARLDGAIKELEKERATAVASGDRGKRTGMRWFAVGLLIFSLWGTGIITEAAVSPTGPRASQWFDPLQIDVMEVTALNSPELATTKPDVGSTHINSLLFLGANGVSYVLYDKPVRSIWLAPERFDRLVLH